MVIESLVPPCVLPCLGVTSRMSAYEYKNNYSDYHVTIVLHVFL